MGGPDCKAKVPFSLYLGGREKGPGGGPEPGKYSI